ncbi:MAG TPA: hypothetical protein VHI55_10395 [Gaiellaceae bacterium]|jgi:hypothetical protein|nr:hypothetical protein [Gaiellaceae bacterium]
MTNPTHPRGSDRGRPGGRSDRGLDDRKPTVRQIYALAAALAERLGEEFPSTAAHASELIERLRTESGHPAPRLEDTLRRRATDD